MGSSLLSFLSPALTAATQAAGAYQGAESQASQMKQQQVMQALQLARQARTQALQEALTTSTIGLNNQRSDALAHPPEKHHYTLVPSQGPDGQPSYAKVDSDTGDVAETNTPLKPPPVPKPDKEPAPHYSVVPITAKDGSIHLARVNTLTGQIDDSGVLGKQPTPKSETGAGAMQGARIGIAQQQASDADRIMSQFEAGLGTKPIPTAGIILAKRALQPDAMGSSAAETILNTQYPDLAQYVRAAKQIAVAERLVSPRGGSNSLTQAEAALSAGGAHANGAQIQQAQAYRRALIKGLSGHGGAKSPTSAGTPPSAGSNPFADLIPSGSDE